MATDSPRCDGVRTTWPWQGYRCCNLGRHEHEDKNYCTVHYGKALAEEKERDESGAVQGTVNEHGLETDAGRD